jgi:hypothetical protein
LKTEKLRKHGRYLKRCLQNQQIKMVRFNFPQSGINYVFCLSD